MLSAKKASLLFDIDNTLIDRDFAFSAYLQDFIHRNQDAFSDENTSLVFKEIITLDCHGRKDRQLFCQELLQRFPRLPYTENKLWEDHMSLPDFVKPDNVVNEILKRLSADYQLLIISNGSSNMQRRKLHQANLADFFEHVFISAEVGYFKPDHRLFSHALNYCRHPNIIMIGDDYINDMQPAIDMQLKTIFINNEKNSIAARSDQELSSIHDIEEALTCMI